MSKKISPKHRVGSVGWSTARPNAAAVFNANYSPEDGRRCADYEKPWVVDDQFSMAIRFATHSEAIEHASTWANPPLANTAKTQPTQETK